MDSAALVQLVLLTWQLIILVLLTLARQINTSFMLQILVETVTLIA
jgi:hypothetical protein